MILIISKIYDFFSFFFRGCVRHMISNLSYGSNNITLTKSRCKIWNGVWNP